MITLTRQKRKARDKRVYAHYCKLMLSEGAMYTACIEALMQKHGLSKSTVKSIIRRESAPLV